MRRIILSSMLLAAALIFLTMPALPQAKEAPRKDKGSKAEGKSSKQAEAAEQASKATQVFREIMDTPDKSIPKSLLDSASCVAVFPSVIKGGVFIVGGRYGRGVVSCRSTNGWSAPIFVEITGGSFGPQLGAEAVDLVLLGMNPRTMEMFTKDRFKIGGEASAAAGPVGRQAAADTDLPTIRSEFLSYSRSRGLFAGLELKGSVIRRENDLNRAVYGAKFMPASVLKSGTAKAPGDIRVFAETLAKYSASKGTKTATK